MPRWARNRIHLHPGVVPHLILPALVRRCPAIEHARGHVCFRPICTGDGGVSAGCRHRGAFGSKHPSWGRTPEIVQCAIRTKPTEEVALSIRTEAAAVLTWFTRKRCDRRPGHRCDIVHVPIGGQAPTHLPAGAHVDLAIERERRRIIAGRSRKVRSCVHVCAHTTCAVNNTERMTPRISEN